MTAFRIDSTTAQDITDMTLRAAPARALTFLQGAADPKVSSLLAKVGWSAHEVQNAWTLLSSLSAIPTEAPAPAVDPMAEAISACEAFQSTALVRAKALLLLGYPAQHDFLFHDYVAEDGIASALAISTFLTRRTELESAEARKASRKLDREALTVIEKAGVTEAEVKRMSLAVKAAQTLPEIVPVDDRNEVLRHDVLRRIHAWVTAWGGVARTVVTRRDQLIRMGLAKRRVKKDAPVVAVPPVVVSPTPAEPVEPDVEEMGPTSHAA